MNATGRPEALRVCEASELVEGGAGVRVDAHLGGSPTSVFFVRYGGAVHGYLNRCAHVPMELDWNAGQFFDSSGLYLMCATHGAIYEPDTGRCVGGPCRGASLRALHVKEHWEARAEDPGLGCGDAGRDKRRLGDRVDGPGRDGPGRSPSEVRGAVFWLPEIDLLPAAVGDRVPGQSDPRP